MNYLNDLQVLVLGLGESGLAMARWCAGCGAQVRVWDSREDAPNALALAELVPAAELLRGALTDAAFAGVKLVLKSPGLSPLDARIAAPLARAADMGVLVQGELDLFARALADLKLDRGYVPKLLAITGTNGKTTTTAMTAMLVARTGKRVAMAGNIGPTMLQTLADALVLEPLVPVPPEPSAVEVTPDSDPFPPAKAPTFANLPEVWVLELSSFQLDDVKGFEPSAATVLNITQDHLDWHGTMDAYAQAKASIFAPGTVRVINRDDARVTAMDDATVPSVRFGLDAPVRAGDFGVGRDLDDAEGLRWIALAEGGDPEAEARGVVPGKTFGKRRGSKPLTAVPDSDTRIKRLMPVDALKIRGDHNVANVLAGLALGRAIGLSMAAMLRAAGGYRGEPHRVAFVLERVGVDWIEDSKGTNVGATVAALQGLGRKVVLIAGGLGKGQDFTPLAAPVAKHARAVLLIGRDKAILRAALASTGVALFDCETLDQAVDEAAELAEPGDAVLLSPACASLDMFRDYEERADVFVAAVHRIDQGIATIEGATC